VGKVFRASEAVNNSSKTARLAAALLRDREARPSAVNSTVNCFLCGRSYTYRTPTGDDSGRFCSARCRENYDAGARAQSSSPQLYSLRPGRAGFFINCAGCQREFESLGLRCCSPECERNARERTDNLAALAEVGMDAPTKRVCEECGGPIPRWRNGRAVPKTARFCKRKCQARSQRKKGPRR
jgi:hypothetical protein